MSGSRPVKGCPAGSLRRIVSRYENPRLGFAGFFAEALGAAVSKSSNLWMRGLKLSVPFVFLQCQWLLQLKSSIVTSRGPEEDRKCPSTSHCSSCARSPSQEQQSSPGRPGCRRTCRGRRVRRIRSPQGQCRHTPCRRRRSGSLHVAEDGQHAMEQQTLLPPSEARL